MLAAVTWHGLAAFTHTGAWRGILTCLEAVALAGALRLLARTW